MQKLFFLILIKNTLITLYGKQKEEANKQKEEANKQKEEANRQKDLAIATMVELGISVEKISEKLQIPVADIENILKK